MTLSNFPKIAVGIDFNQDECINWATVENVSEYVLSCDWQLGQTSGEDRMPSEGTATITLDNTSKLFSPEYTGSILHGAMLANLLVAIYIYDEQETEWVRMWVGYVDHYEPHPRGTAGDNQTVVHCIQGLVKLNNASTFNYDMSLTDAYADEIIERIFALNTWRAPLKGRPLIVGTGVVGDTLTSGVDSLVAVDSGVRRYPSAGPDWGNSSDAMRGALEDIATTEQGYWLVNRDGELSFRSKAYLSTKKSSFDKVASTATSVKDMTYRFVNRITNIFETIYYPNAQVESIPIWTGHEDIRANDSLNFTAVAQRDDGTNMTIISLDEISLDIYANDNHDNVTDQIIQNYVITPRGVEVSLNNPLDRDVRMHMQLSCKVLRKQNGLSVKRLNLTKMAEVNEPIQTTYDLPMLPTRHSATRYAEYEDCVVSGAYGIVDSVVMPVKDNKSLNRILVSTIESVLLVQDTHIGLTSEFYLITGERFTWNVGSLSAEYILTKIENRPDVYLVGSSSLVGTATLL